jgi:sulfoxide reductase heme-binding subunit YedZ
VLAQRELARAIGRSGGDVVVASLSMTWVATRAAGYTAFALLTASVALGLLLSSPLRPTRWPRFATTELHRFVTLLTLVFIAIHVLVALLDSFIGFSLSDVLVPFTSNYRPVWMGLGIVSAYLAAALWASSWLQRRIGYRWWRRLHFGTFGVYVGAALHGIGAGSDTGWAWSWTIYLASFALVGALVVVRLPDRASRTPAPSRASRPRHRGLPFRHRGLRSPQRGIHRGGRGCRWAGRGPGCGGGGGGTGRRSGVLRADPGAAVAGTRRCRGSRRATGGCAARRLRRQLPIAGPRLDPTGELAAPGHRQPSVDTEPRRRGVVGPPIASSAKSTITADR